MIESAFGYKFRDHVSETILYEDQVVEHMVTTALARRRVFPKRLLQDEVAYQAIRDQVRLSASISHPNVPTIFMAGVHKDQYLVIQQHFQGETLELIAQRKHAQASKDWILIARRLVRLLANLQINGIAFDRIHLRDVLFSNQLIIFNSRYPVGKTSGEALTKSPYLQRLFESSTSGIYHVQGRFPMNECLIRAKELLYHLACAAQFDTIDAGLEHHAERSRGFGQGGSGSSLLGLDHAIEEVLLRLHHTNDGNSIRTLDDLIVVLDQFQVIKTTAPTLPHGMRQVTSTSKTEVKFAPDFEAAPASSAKAAIAAAGSLIAKPVTPTSERRAPEAPKVTPNQARDYQASGGGPKEMISAKADEDAEEDRSYLYPTAPRTETAQPAAKSSSSSESLQQNPVSSYQAPTRSAPNIPWKQILGVLGVIVLVFGLWIAVSILPALQKKPNTAPTAKILAAEGTTTKPTGKIALSASESSDAEGDSLTYTWNLRGEGITPTDYALEPTAPNSSSITASVFKTGTYTVELVVFDGQLKSAPVTIDLTFEGDL